MTGPARPRLDFGVVARIVSLGSDRPLTERGKRGASVDSHAGDDGWCSDAYLALVLGTSRRQVQRWWHEGLTLRAADRVAVELGLTPHLIWGSEWERLSEAGVDRPEGACA